MKVKGVEEVEQLPEEKESFKIGSSTTCQKEVFYSQMRQEETQNCVPGGSKRTCQPFWTQCSPQEYPTRGLGYIAFDRGGNW